MQQPFRYEIWALADAVSIATVTIELPARLFATLQRSPKEAKAIEKDVLLAAAIDWYGWGA